MRKLGGILLLIAALSTVASAPAFAQQAPLVDAYSMIGSLVKGADGKDLGKINQLMVDPRDGKIVYAVVAVGGMLGVGEKLVAVPWNAVKLSQAQGKLIATIDRALLEQAPAMNSSPAASPSTDPNAKK